MKFLVIEETQMVDKLMQICSNFVVIWEVEI